MRTVVTIMSTATAATERAEATTAVGKGTVDVEGCSVETGVMVSVKPTIEKKKYRLSV